MPWEAAKRTRDLAIGGDFFNSIVKHVNKSADSVAIDLQGASKEKIKPIQKFVGGLAKKDQEKIIYVK